MRKITLDIKLRSYYCFGNYYLTPLEERTTEMSRERTIAQHLETARVLEEKSALWAGLENNACQCYPCSIADSRCICPRNEWALRCYVHGEVIRPMTIAEREWCLGEIGRVEGYERNDHTQDLDADLARTVIDAWVTYCRDKGLL